MSSDVSWFCAERWNIHANQANQLERWDTTNKLSTTSSGDLQGQLDLVTALLQLARIKTFQK